MGSGIEFGKGVLDEILARAAGSRDEVCGLLLGRPDAVEVVLHCRNVAAEPRVSFEIDPKQLFAAHRAARAGGPAIVGCYHSHPGGDPTPSPRDAVNAATNGWVWVIVSGEGVGVFRAVEKGEIHGRFDNLPTAP